MAKDIAEVIEMIKIYTEAQNKILDIIGSGKRVSKAYETRIIKQTNYVLKQLINESKIWTNSKIPRQYKKAVNEAVTRAKNMGIEMNNYTKYETLHQEQINILIENTTDKYVIANSFVGRRINDTIRNVGLTSLRESLILNRSLTASRNDIISRLIDNNVTSIKTSNGRNLNLTSYAETLARSVMAESKNLAVIRHLQYDGFDLVRMSSHSTSCEVCAPLQGRVYSISGLSDIYPPLRIAYGGIYANIHPNCRHFLIPYFPEKDPDREKTIEFSRRSFNIDPRSSAQIDAYNERQRQNQKRARDRRQWEKFKLMVPGMTPKTLTAFRRWKSQQNDKYKKLLKEYKSRISK